LLEAGIDLKTILNWTKDPQVDLGNGEKGSLFDALEDMNAGDCLARACEIAQVKPSEIGTTNSAFVFIKPHAVTEAVKELVKSAFKTIDIKVLKEGELTSEVIEKEKLIDNHYYAIANKASLTKPKDLNPPEDKTKIFAEMFGLTWEEALAAGVVYNAVDGCNKAGFSGDEMNTAWAASKKNKLLVKFGGGFYCGKISYEESNKKMILAVIAGTIGAGLAGFAAYKFMSRRKN